MLKLLKNKENRDTLLLGFMGLITLLFLLYVFIPGGNDSNDKPPDGGKNSKNHQTKPVKDKGKNVKKPAANNSGKSVSEKPSGDNKEKCVREAHAKLCGQLSEMFVGIVKSPSPFVYYDASGILELEKDFKTELTDKLAKYSFNNLREIPDLEFLGFFDSRVKFDIYISLFLVKIKEENIDGKFEELPDGEFRAAVDMSVYKLLNNEVEEDYQLLPVLFYFKHLMKRLNIYPADDSLQWFKEKINSIKDLTPSKYLVKVQEMLNFSSRPEHFRLNWREHDGLGPDDKKEYRDLQFNIIRFLKQEYLVFPDLKNSERNQWITDIFNSDPGEIELIKLNIQNLDPAYHNKPPQIVYTPLSPVFTILLKPYEPHPGNDFFNQLVTERITAYNLNFTMITLTNQVKADKSLQNQLTLFGNHLKKSHNPQQ